MDSLKSLVQQARSMLESSGDARKNAHTTLSVAVQQMSKDVESLKTSSKQFSTSISQLPSMLTAAHELTEPELKSLKKLLDQLSVTKEKLKKYVLYADTNVKDAQKLADGLGKPGPSSRIGPEPDPDKPFAVGGAVKDSHKPQKAILPKPDWSADQWQLYTVDSAHKMASKKAAVGLNAAAAKALDYLETELPKVNAPGGKSGKSAIDKVLLHAFQKFVSPAMNKYSKSGASDTEPEAFIQLMLSHWTRAILKDDSLTFDNVW